MAGPKPKKRGPNRGDNDGGVCPEDELLAVRRASSESSLTIMNWREGSNSGRKAVAKWVEGYPRARRKVLVSALVRIQGSLTCF